MAKLSKTQMRAYAASVGFPNPALMAEVGWAESGGDTKVVNSIGAVGVLQILQPVHVKDHPSWTVSWLQNPLNNFRAGKVLFDQDVKAGGNGLRPWADSANKGNGGGWAKTATGVAFFGDDDPLDDFWDGLFGDQERGPGSEQWEEDMPGLPSDVLPDLSGLTDLAKLGIRMGEWMSNPRNWLNVVYVLTGGVVVAMTLSASVRNQITGTAAKMIGKGK